MQQVLSFLTDLACNNNREWFHANKSRYDEALATFTDFTARYIEGLQQVDSTLAGLTPKDCMWRIYRDTRFSADKTPYKDHFGAFPAAPMVAGKPATGGKKSDRAGYYVHIQPGQCMFAAGMWCPNKDLLLAVRREIEANYEEIETMFADEHFSGYFPEFDQSYKLKRVPLGFDPSFVHADWLKHKWYIISTPFTDKQVCDPGFLEHLLDVAVTAKPLNDFLNYTFEEYGEFPG